ncbi:MAG: penicillin-binding protein 1C [Burkholderiales bacterium]
MMEKGQKSFFCRFSATVTFVTFVTIYALPTPAAAEVQSFDSVKKRWTSTEGALLDRHGELIHELRVSEQGRRLAWISLEDISPAALATIIRAEDKRFYQHHGVDWLAMSDAALDTVLLSQPRGASTISMQVAAQLNASLRPARKKRTVSQKWDQISASRELEQSWSKREILEAYLNLSTFRGELQGIGAASRGLFNKEPSGLDAPESLLLAVLLRGPNAKSEAAARRACQLAARMAPELSCPALQRLAQAALPAAPNIAGRVALAPHVARELLSTDHPRVQTTLDGALQEYATALLQQQLAELSASQVTDAAALVVDNRSGEVLAYVGNAGGSTRTNYVDGVRAPRQAGSTLKPFLYELALERKFITAASLIDDSPVNLLTPSGLYVPQNYDRDFKGLVSARTALSSSLNVPAVRTLMLIGADAFVERLQAFGFEDIVHDGDFYGFSLALGSAEVSLWQLTNAYRALANGGTWSALKLQRSLKTAMTPVAGPAASWIVASMLSDALARSVTFGLDNPLASRYWAAVKTGTSKDMRDNWCVGFTERFTIGVWVGNFDGSPMRDVSGVTGAAPVWAALVDYLHRRTPSSAPQQPQEVSMRRIEYEQDIEAARPEYFIVGTELDVVAVKSPGVVRSGIAYPGNGSIIALDPDIPPDVQRVRFVAVPQLPGQRWQLDGEALGPAEQSVWWTPQPGKHNLVLVDAIGLELDHVQFEVRGAARTQ